MKLSYDLLVSEQDIHYEWMNEWFIYYWKMYNIGFTFMLENSFYSEGTIESRGCKMNRPNLNGQMFISLRNGVGRRKST